MKKWELEVLIQEVTEKISNLDPELNREVLEQHISDIDDKMSRIKQILLWGVMV